MEYLMLETCIKICNRFDRLKALQTRERYRLVYQIAFGQLLQAHKTYIKQYDAHLGELKFCSSSSADRAVERALAWLDARIKEIKANRNKVSRCIDDLNLELETAEHDFVYAVCAYFSPGEDSSGDEESLQALRSALESEMRSMETGGEGYRINIATIETLFEAVHLKSHWIDVVAAYSQLRRQA